MFPKKGQFEGRKTLKSENLKNHIHKHFGKGIKTIYIIYGNFIRKNFIAYRKGIVPN